MIEGKRFWGWLSAVILCGIVIAVACQTGPSTTDDDEIQGGTEQRVDKGDETAKEIPSRIIFFVGDGMGLPYVTATSYVTNEPLSMLDMSDFGMISTHEYEFVTTDSAASATAMATGEKTHFEGVSVRPGTTTAHEEREEYQFRTVMDAAQDADWSTGLVSTVRVTHATPGPFAAHRSHRRQYEDIALDISKSGVDVLLGAGSKYFVERDDGRDLLSEMESRGYRIAHDGDEVRNLVGEVERLVGLVHSSDMPWADEGDRELELAEMVEQSIEILDGGEPAGFFLMVEGAKIDWAGHEMDGGRSVSETLDMDRGIRRALEYARDRSDTLVVVTADHETGGLDVIDGPTADRYLEVLGGAGQAAEQTVPAEIDRERRSGLSGPFEELDYGSDYFWPAELEDGRLLTSFGFKSAASRAFWDGESRFSAAHTPLMVPVFADGAGAKKAASVRDNADLGRQFMAWIDGEEADVEYAGGEQREAISATAKNVVLLIGEGFGMGSLTATYYGFGVPSMFEMEQAAAVDTHSLDALVNDSAGGATALSTGVRTRRGVVGMAPEQPWGRLEHVPTVMEQAIEHGRATGLVTTSSLTDGVPAAFFAHRQDTRDQEAIATDFVELYDRVVPAAGIDFVAAGGALAFDTEKRHQLVQQGYAIHDAWDEAPTSQRDLYLLADDAMEPALHGGDDDDSATLAAMTSRAMRTLSGQDQGYFLAVHTGQIADAKRAMDRGERLMAELRAFDEAVGTALQLASEDEQTLVVATSDVDFSLSVLDNHYGFHSERCGAVTDCGGEFELQWQDVSADDIRHGQGFGDHRMQGEYGSPQIALQYTWLAQQAAEVADVKGGRTANFVPLFAHGPGAHNFGGVMEQPQIGRWLVDWAKGRADEPAVAQ